MSTQPKPCGSLFSYFLQELSPVEADAFAAHVQECPSCREELAELRQTWEALPYAMEEKEMPQEARERVLEAILNGEGLNEAGDVRKEQPSAASLPAYLPAPAFRRKTLAYAAAAAVVSLMVGGLAAWGWMAARGGETNQADVRLLPPAQVVKQLSLKAFDKSMPQASGTGWLTRQGDLEQLVLQLNGLASTTGEEAYQVWLIKEGKRYNGGTFRVDAQGRGVLTLELRESETAFEAVGITLEPDANGVQPRGRKVLGT
ncbi:anti-sigma factor domain-containing protein [Paenibacillus sp. MBLB4367]|uniref:anti-sigma factor n=1 Tax=Paenibacillus sp. MBLB4367 TaxID=3384767 RepID=UPI003908377E